MYVISVLHYIYIKLGYPHSQPTCIFTQPVTLGSIPQLGLPLLFCMQMYNSCNEPYNALYITVHAAY